MSGSDPSQSSAASTSAPAHLPLDIHDPSATLRSSHRCHPHLYFPSHWRHEPSQSAGAGPFVTKLVHSLPSGNTVSWESRKHRKQLQQSVQAPTEEKVRERVEKGELSAKDGEQLLARGRKREELRRPWYRRLFPFKPEHISWWTAVLFDLGSVCFVFSSICAFIPGIYDSASLNTGYVGWTAFAGSLFFTVGSLFGVAEVLKAPIIGHWFALSKEEEERLGALAQEQKSRDAASSKAAATFLSLLSRLDFYLTVIQMIGATAFSINTLAFSGQWQLGTHETTWLVDFCDVFASLLLHHHRLPGHSRGHAQHRARQQRGQPAQPGLVHQRAEPVRRHRLPRQRRPHHLLPQPGSAAAGLRPAHRQRLLSDQQPSAVHGAGGQVRHRRRQLRLSRLRGRQRHAAAAASAVTGSCCT